MFKNYIKLAFRNLYKDKTFSFINIMGLTIGLACFVLIMLWVKDELSYDRFHKNVDHLYRITMKNDSMDKFWAITPLALSDVIRTEYPGLENSARYTNILTRLANANCQTILLSGRVKCINARIIYVPKIFQPRIRFVMLVNLAVFFQDPARLQDKV